MSVDINTIINNLPMLYSLLVFYSVCAGENEEHERKSSERISGIGGRQNNLLFTHLILKQFGICTDSQEQKYKYGL